MVSYGFWEMFDVFPVGSTSQLTTGGHHLHHLGSGTIHPKTAGKLEYLEFIQQTSPV